MHWQAFQYFTTIREFFPEYFANTATLEVGSYCVNGSVRELFDSDQYVGIDLSKGDGVDIVASGHKFTSTNKFDVSISCECFEHNPYFKETLLNMINLTTESGLILFSCATDGRQEHGTSRTDPSLSPGTSSVKWDYYQNLNELHFKDLNLHNILKFHAFFYNHYSHDMYFIGTKSNELARKLSNKYSDIIDAITLFECLSSQKCQYVGELSNIVKRDICPRLLFELFRNYEQYSENNLNLLNKIIEQCYFSFPLSAESNYFLAAKCRKENNVEQGLKFAKRAKILSNSNAFFVHYYALLLADLRLYNKAIEEIKSISSVDHEAPLLWKLADFYFKLSDYKESWAYNCKALELEPKNPVFLLLKAKLSLKLNRTTELKGACNSINSLAVCPEWIRKESSKLIS